MSVEFYRNSKGMKEFDAPSERKCQGRYLDLRKRMD
jgi:hypothetical protein